MTPYEHLLAKAEEIGWPAHHKNDLTGHDKESLDGCPDTMPFMWFVRECGTWLITPNGVGFGGHEGGGLLRASRAHTEPSTAAFCGVVAISGR